MNQSLHKLIDNHSYDGTLFSFGRNVYKSTDCGPWVAFELSDGTALYYEDKQARVTLDELEEKGITVTAIEIGSIVEGSDVEVNSILVEVDDSFTESEFWEAVNGVDEEAKFYWKRDNATYYSLRDDQGNVLVWCEWEHFDDDPRCPPPGDQHFELAKVAGAALMGRSSKIPDDVPEPVPGHPGIFAWREETPDITY